MKSCTRRCVIAAPLALLVFVVAMPAISATDTCLDCHASPDLKVRAPGLQACYQAWRNSPHAKAGVGCADCHGGGDAATRDQCPSTSERNVNDFRRIPETCGQCHQVLLMTFRESVHFTQLQEAQAGKEGPNCVTCHGSMGASRVETAQVEALCATCHDGVRASDDGIPARARSVLEVLLGVRQFSAWLGLHTQDPELEVNERSKQIAHWHRFELAALEMQSAKQLEELKARVNDVRVKEGQLRREKRKLGQKE